MDKHIELLSESGLDFDEALLEVCKAYKRADQNNIPYATFIDYLDNNSHLIETYEYFMELSKNFPKVAPIYGVKVKIATPKDCYAESIDCVLYPQNAEGIQELLNIQKRMTPFGRVDGDEEDSYIYWTAKWNVVYENCQNLVMGLMLQSSRFLMATMESIVQWAFVPDFVFVTPDSGEYRVWESCSNVVRKHHIFVVPTMYAAFDLFVVPYSDEIDNSIDWEERFKFLGDDYKEICVKNPIKVIGLIKGDIEGEKIDE